MIIITDSLTGHVYDDASCLHWQYKLNGTDSTKEMYKIHNELTQ